MMLKTTPGDAATVATVATARTVFASAARIVKMVAVCLAIACAPTACTVLTGVTPTYCGEGCQDV